MADARANPQGRGLSSMMAVLLVMSSSGSRIRNAEFTRQFFVDASRRESADQRRGIAGALIGQSVQIRKRSEFDPVRLLSDPTWDRRSGFGPGGKAVTVLSNR